MTVGSVSRQAFSRHVPAATLAGCLFAPAAAFAQQPSTKSAAVQGQPADRIVAEWMLRMGGSVSRGSAQPITDLADLPTGELRIHT